MMRIGLFGGTFDPIHNGHLRAAIELLEQLELDRVHLIPAAVPPHRPQPQFSATERLALLRLALEGQVGLEADDCELERGGPSYSIDTLREMRRRFPDAVLHLALGVDAYNGLPQWHQAAALLDECHLIVLKRPGTELADLGLSAGRMVERKDQLRGKPAGLVLTLDIPQLAISATQVRDKLARGLSLFGLLPDAVAGRLGSMPRAG